ncbi:MAG: hypothetical protein GY715_09540 [Planctomycetes bacterium]|nr:hypothetical protein [Planctomycetota bacterium]
MRDFRGARAMILLSVSALLGGCVAAESASYQRHLAGRVKPSWTASTDVLIAADARGDGDATTALGVLSGEPLNTLRPAHDKF